MVGLAKNLNHTTIVTIEKVIDETPTVRTLIFSDEVMSNVLPGQFAMVWIPGINELPMSVMISEKSGKAAFTVRKHGLHQLDCLILKLVNKLEFVDHMEILLILKKENFASWWWNWSCSNDEIT